MNHKAINLLAACKNISAFGITNAADFPANSTGGKQFAIITAAVTSNTNLGATQVSGKEQSHSGVLSKAIGRKHLHDHMIAIVDAAHSLVLLGHTALAEKFLMPHSNGDQALLNAAHAFQTDAAEFSALFIDIGLDDDFLNQLGNDIVAFEAAIGVKGTGTSSRGGATGGISDTTHQATIALHILNTVVRNKYKNNPAKLAEWIVASHVAKHTPVPRKKPASTPPPA